MNVLQISDPVSTSSAGLEQRRKSGQVEAALAVGQRPWMSLDLPQSPSLALKPQHLFFELGLNRGQTFLDLLGYRTTDAVPDRNRIRPILRTLLGGREFNQSEFCFYGFEANPGFTKQLREMEARLKAAGHCVTLHVETIAGTSSSQTVPFFVDGRVDATHGKEKQFYAEGSTFDARAATDTSRFTEITVASIDFAAFLRSQLLDKRKSSLAVLRMDIEGGEYVVLKHLLQPLADASRPPVCMLDLLIIEFHAKRSPPEEVAQHIYLRDELARLCPELRVVLDRDNYKQPPFKGAWPLPPEYRRR